MHLRQASRAAMSRRGQYATRFPALSFCHGIRRCNGSKPMRLKEEHLIYAKPGIENAGEREWKLQSAEEAGQKSGQPCRTLGQQRSSTLSPICRLLAHAGLHANLEDYCTAPHTTCRRHQVSRSPGSLDMLGLQAILHYHQRHLSVQGSTTLACHPSSWQEWDACCQVAYLTLFQHKLQPVSPIPVRSPSNNPQPGLQFSVARDRYNPAASYLQEPEPSPRPEVGIVSACRTRLKKSPEPVGWLPTRPPSQRDRPDGHASDCSV